MLLFSLLFSGPAYAASLHWDGTYEGLLDVEFSETANGQWSFVRRIPAQPPFFPVEKFGYYRLTIPGGQSSNPAKLSVDVIAEQPPTVNNVTAKQLDADHIEITGQACTSLKTTGSGLKRVVECVH